MRLFAPSSTLVETQSLSQGKTLADRNKVMEITGPGQERRRFQLRTGLKTW
jgi:hypothetical protein